MQYSWWSGVAGCPHLAPICVVIEKCQSCAGNLGSISKIRKHLEIPTHSNESMLPRNVTSDDIVESQKLWKWSGTQGQYFRGWQSTYQSSPFPYKWDFHTRSSIIPSDETMAVNKDRYWSTVPLSSFKPRFHKAKVRWLMSKKLLLIESEIGSNFGGIYRK